jgi:hypothetical protein
MDETYLQQEGGVEAPNRKDCYMYINTNRYSEVDF